MSYTQSFCKTAVQEHFFFPLKDHPPHPPVVRTTVTPSSHYGDRQIVVALGLTGYQVLHGGAAFPGIPRLAGLRGRDSAPPCTGLTVLEHSSMAVPWHGGNWLVQGGGGGAKGGGGGGGLGKGLSSLKPLMMTYQLRRKATGKFLFSNNFPMMIPQNDQRILRIILSHICWGTSGPPTAPNLPCQPVGGPRHGSPEGRGGGLQERGSNAPPLPRTSQSSPSP